MKMHRPGYCTFTTPCQSSFVISVSLIYWTVAYTINPSVISSHLLNLAASMYPRLLWGRPWKPGNTIGHVTSLQKRSHVLKIFSISVIRLAVSTLINMGLSHLEVN